MQRPPPSSPRSRAVDFLNGIGVRLFIAFGIVSVTTVLAGIVAFISFTQLGDTVDALTAGTLPAMEASLDVVKAGSDISAAAPAMLAARTRPEAATVSKDIITEQQQLADAMARLSGHEREAANLAGYVNEMRRQLTDLTQMVDQRFTLRGELERAIQGITAAQRDIAENLAPQLDNAAFDLTMEVSPPDISSKIDLEDRLAHTREIKLPELQDLNDLRSESNRLTGLLTAAVIAPNPEMLTPLRDSATSASRQIARALTDLGNVPGSAKPPGGLATLQAYMIGDKTVFDLRGAELRLVAQAETVLVANRALAGELNEVAQRVVQDEHARAQAAAERSHAGIKYARRVLAGIAILSSVLALTIAWYYVGRRVVRRLNVLASVMYGLADGNTNVTIPDHAKRDEIAAMGDALKIFRNNLIENRRLTAEREQQQRQAEEGQRAALTAMHAKQEIVRLRELTDSTFEGLLIHHDGTVIDANAAFCDMVGLGLTEIRGQPLERFASTSADALGGRTVEKDGRMREITVTTGTGDGLPVEARSRDMIYGGVAARITAFRDLREQHAAEEQIRFLAHHDLLTGLANRFKLLHTATRELAASRRHGKPLAVLCVDLDRFKSVNDTLGHHVGDLLLRQVADRIRENVRDVDTAARVGGDEFIILQTAIDQPLDAARLARRLIDRLSEPYDIGGQQVRIGASVGIALHPQDGEQVENLMKYADLALYRVKGRGRGDFCFYESGMDTAQRERRELKEDLAHAIRSNQLAVAFQPIFNADFGDVVAFEALARWVHPTRGNIPPSDFIPLAEETKLIIPLGEWVLETACQAAMTWHRACRVAVNVSVHQFSGGDMPATVAAVLKRTGLPADRLELEVTESLLITDTEHALRALEALRRLGVRIVLGDFGTGYASLSYLQRFSFDKIKVDKSFIEGLTRDSGTHAIVGAILAMSHQLNVKVTAEGVETKAQLALLRSEHCDEIQGFLLGRPMSADRVGDYLAGVCSEIEAEETTVGPEYYSGPHSRPAAKSPELNGRRTALTDAAE